jgi:hypothetical protein
MFEGTLNHPDLSGACLIGHFDLARQEKLLLLPELICPLFFF